MEAIILPKEAYEAILTKLDAITSKLSEGDKPPQETWLTNAECCKLLKVSSRTLQNYRDNGILPFSQSQNKIYYKLSDIEAYLNNHYIKGR
jgi:hypothetical protein